MEVVSTVGSLLERHEHVPYVIHGAGVNPAAPTTEISPEGLEPMQVNAFTPVYLTRELLLAVREHGSGRVVNLTPGPRFPAGIGPFSASKPAIDVFATTAAREHTDEDIRTSPMSPRSLSDGGGSRHAPRTVGLPSDDRLPARP